MPGKEAKSKKGTCSDVVNPASRIRLWFPLLLFFSNIVFPQFPSWFCVLFPFISSQFNSYQYSFTSCLRISLLVTPSLFEWLHISLNVNSETPVLLSVLLSTKCWTITFWKLLTGATALHGLGFLLIWFIVCYTVLSQLLPSLSSKL